MIPTAFVNLPSPIFRLDAVGIIVYQLFCDAGLNKIAIFFQEDFYCFNHDLCAWLLTSLSRSSSYSSGSSFSQYLLIWSPMPKMNGRMGECIYIPPYLLSTFLHKHISFPGNVNIIISVATKFLVPRYLWTGDNGLLVSGTSVTKTHEAAERLHAWHACINLVTNLYLISYSHLYRWKMP